MIISDKQNRPLGGFEKTFWLLDMIGSKDFAIVAEIDGRREQSNWEVALRALQYRHPNLRVSIRNNAHGQPEFFEGEHQVIPLRVVQAPDNFDWSGEVQQELAVRFDTSIAPLIRCVIIEKSCSTVIILIAHHAISDGTSLTLLIRDLLISLNGQPLETLAAAVANDTLVGLAVDRAADKGNDEHPVSFEIYRNSKDTDMAGQVSRIMLSEKLSAGLLAASRQQKTTVHGALCAAALLAARKLTPEWTDRRIEMISPICSRRALHLGDDCNLNITTHPVYFETEESNDFWELARKAKNGLGGTTGKDHITGYLSFFQNLVFGTEEQEMLNTLKSAFTHDIMVTNLGRIKFGTEYGDLKLKSLWGPMVLSGKGKEQTIGALSINGSIHLTNTSRKPMPGFLETVEGILSDAC